MKSHSPYIGRSLLKKCGMAELYAGNMREREMRKNFMLSYMARKTHYLCSETALCIGSREEINWSSVEARENK